MSALVLLAVAGFLWWAYQQADPRGPRKKSKRPAELANPAAAAKRPARSDRPPPADDNDPRRVLGVAADASSDEIRKAYQDKVRQYHPDRVAGAAPELQRLAERRTKELNAAYQALIREER